MGKGEAGQRQARDIGQLIENTDALPVQGRGRSSGFGARAASWRRLPAAARLRSAGAALQTGFPRRKCLMYFTSPRSAPGRNRREEVGAGEAAIEANDLNPAPPGTCAPYCGSCPAGRRD